MPRKYKNILIVEDDHSIREAMKLVLEYSGYDVHIAKDGADALKKLKALKSVPCLIITDLMMPKMDGYEFLSHLSKNQALVTVPVIVMSAHGTAMHPHKFIKKPFDLEILLKIIETSEAEQADR
jgi:two-component system, chemotaxis family, sensor histidine kinase and response regulator PixL